MFDLILLLKFSVKINFAKIIDTILNYLTYFLGLRLDLQFYNLVLILLY